MNATPEPAEPTPALPACCVPTDDATAAERAYCAYNRAGDPATAGRNYRGDPCPEWAELPENVRAKWEAAVGRPNRDEAFEGGSLVRLRSGGPVMTVSEPYAAAARCAWFDETESQHFRAEFTNCSLVLVEA